MSEAGKARKPIYVEVQDYLLELINGPDYGPGDRIPSERTLADALGINRMTVRKAIDRLVDRNLLERNGTSGTRVPLVPATRPAELRPKRGVTRLIRQAQGEAGSRLLHFAEEPASESLAQRLRLAPGSAVVMIRRLRSFGETPFCVETSYLPAELVPDLLAEDLMAGQALHDMLAERYGLAFSADEREISVGAATELEARQLGLVAGAPTLMLRLVTHDEHGRPVDYTVSVNHPDHVVFRSSGTAQVEQAAEMASEREAG